MKNKTISGKYKIIRELGRGGMGVVHKAYDKNLKIDVAIKELHAQSTGNSGSLERFKREAQAMALLKHDNIISVYGWEEDSGTSYIVMEYFEGKNLQEILKKPNGLTIKASLEIVLQVAKALSYAHKRGIIHRDIKPENIMVNDAGLAKIADFGIAAITDEVPLTMSGHRFMGTLRYMSPEQAREEKVDPRSDLYSFGVVLYEMLTGKELYRGIPGKSIYEFLLHEKKLRLTFPADIPSPLQKLVRSLLRKKVKSRLCDAATLVDHLSNILSKYDLTLSRTRTINSLPQPGSGSGKKLALVGGLGLIVLLVVGIGAYFISQHEEVPIQKEILKQEKEERTRVARELETRTLLLEAERKILELEKNKAEQARLAQEEKTKAEQARLGVCRT